MRAGTLTSFAAAIVLAALAGAPGARAAEDPAVGAATRVLRGRVVKVDGKETTISIGSDDGLRKGFKLTCAAKGWSGKVVSVAEKTAVLEVDGEAAVGDAVETKLTTVLTEKPAGAPGEAPKPAAPAPGPEVNGLQLTLLNKEIVRVYVVRRRPAPAAGGAQGGKDAAKAPEGEKREHRYKSLVAEIRNVSKEPVVLPYVSPYGLMRGTELKLELFARDTEGKEVPRRDFERTAFPQEPGEKPVNVTVLKPGQSVDVVVHPYRLKFPGQGTYRLRAEFESKPDAAEVLPGIKLWSGKLTSNQLEFKHEVRDWRNRGPGQPKVPDPKEVPDKEVF
jgi:hypothetical protein